MLDAITYAFWKWYIDFGAEKRKTYEHLFYK